MAIDTDKLKSETDIVQVVGSYTELTKRGHEFIGKCVAHNDSEASMTVSPQKGFAHCFSCGFHADVIDFIVEVENLEFKEACQFLGAKDDWTPSLSTPPVPKIPDRITVKPARNSRPDKLTIAIKDEKDEWVQYDPVKTWDYNDVDGGLLGIAARYQVNGDKEIRMWTYATRGDDEAKWGCGHFNYPRPLFNLDKLSNDDKPVLFVEGEKAASAASVLIPQYTATTWSGGANSLKKTTLEPLRGKKVILMPDNDEAGIACMLRLAETLSDPKGLNCNVKILDTSGTAAKWDIANALEDKWTSDKFIKWAKERVTQYERKQTEPEKKTPKEAVKEKPKLAVVNTPERTIAEGNTLKKIPATSKEVEILPPAMSPSFFAHKFVDLYGDNWRFISQFQRWLRWDGDTWVIDHRNKYFQQGWELADSATYWDEARNLNDNQRKSLSFRAFIGGFLDLARSADKIASEPDLWDAHNMLLGVPGGVIDLATGVSIEGAREQLISRKTEISPKKGGCPLWISTINRATNNSKEMLDYLQRMAGYLLTGETKEECFFFVYGPGASGKSTFCRTLTEILKDYAQAASVDAFMARSNNEHQTEIARMAGVRLITATETDEGARWNESRIKALTGRDKISARFMRGDLFDFQPTAKIMIAGNHKPQLRSVGEEMKRRIHLIDFPTTIPEADRDRDLNEKLKLEYPQILNWMIEGAIKWNKDGLNRPDSVKDATNEYLASEDGYGEWLSECCEIDASASVPVSSAYKSFKSWCEQGGEYCPSQKRFSQRLVDRGFSRIKSGVSSLGGFRMKVDNSAYKDHYSS